jgi:diaminopimelate decarboxylase
MTPLPSHAPHDFPIIDGHMHLGGQRIGQLALRAGQTPFYALDRARIRERVAAVRRALPSRVAVHYAVKANPLPALLGWMAHEVDGLDVASGQELRHALDSGMNPAHISFAGPGKRDTEWRQAIGSGVLLHVESLAEVDALSAIADETGLKARVAVRINPDFELKKAGMKMAGGPKPFGVDAEQVPACLDRIAQSPGLAFEGFHVFAGSQNVDAQALIATQKASVALVSRLAHHAPAPVTHVNLGGGFGIPYFPGERPLDIGAVGHALAEALSNIDPILANARFSLELGRYLVGEAGIYVCRVLERKVSRGQVFLITDGGLHHHLAASGNFGQVIRKNYPLVLPDRITEPSVESVHVVGPLCTPLDILGQSILLPEARKGDLVAVLQSGAYGASASPQGFLGHPPVVEMLV